ncbi:Sec1 family domain-containing protein 1 [Schistosoma japonicum]|nr:Sec1 family domain-containing protein 1 [Schistosoma japonicum]
MAGAVKIRQIEALKCMLNLNSTPNSSDGPQWKILIYDQLGRDIISPLLTVKDLRMLGVTLHLMLNSPREQIPDVPAVYFVYPSKDNILSICKDFEAGRYDSYYLNFISPISREYLEEIAQTALSENCVHQISKVFDQYTNFICLEDDLFTLSAPNDGPSSFYALNRSKATETDIENIVRLIVDGLFSIFATLGSVPIIRCPRGNASEMVASQLDSKFRDSLRDSRNSLFVNNTARSYGITLNDESSGDRLGFNSSLPLGFKNRNSQINSSSNLFQRPLLIILDRSLDLASPLHHELSYQSLIHDIFNIHLNRIHVNLDLAKPMSNDEKSKVSGSGKKSNSKSIEYDLTGSCDRIWRDFRGAAFSDVADAIHEEVTILKDYDRHMSDLKSSLGGSTDVDILAASPTMTFLDDSTTKLTNAINSLPQLMERKRCLDMHTNIATCLANIIKDRQIHSFAEEEDHFFAKNNPSTEHSFNELISNPSIGTPEDKLRLLIIAALAGTSRTSTNSSNSGSTIIPSGSSSALNNFNSYTGSSVDFYLSDAEIDHFKTLLRNSYPNLDISPVNYVQHFRRIPKAGQLADNVMENVKGTGSRSVLNKLVSHGSAILLTGMRHLIGQKSYLPFTRIVSQLMENKSGSEFEDYRYYDPKVYRRQDTNVPRVKQPFDEAFVFVVGGGSYVEYQNLLDWVKSTSSTTSGSSNTSSVSLTNSVNGMNSRSGPGGHDSSNSPILNSTFYSKHVTYGCSDLVSPCEFLTELGKLGKEL